MELLGLQEMTQNAFSSDQPIRQPPEDLSFEGGSVLAQLPHTIELGQMRRQQDGLTTESHQILGEKADLKGNDSII